MDDKMLYYSVSAASARGCRKYMEDRMVLKQIRDKESNLICLFFAVLDGHGGPQASEHVKERLWNTISKMDGFESDDDSTVLNSMRQAFLQIHEEMKGSRDSWPLRPNGYASTAGTTCSCALIRNNKIYTAHCGDSRIVLLSENDDEECVAIDLTQDHKPDDAKERLRIEQDGGKVSSFTPVARVMWTREINNNGDTHTESIPFLSIGRSLGDYWSFVPSTKRYAVCPEPDCDVHEIDLKRDKYIVILSDGITNIMPSNNIAELFDEWRTGMVRNMSRYLLKTAIGAWGSLKADNMSVICVGLHDLVKDDEFTPVYDLNVDTQIDLRLTSNPREIVLLYPQKVVTTNPEWDDLIVARMDIDDPDTEFYVGPGYINRTSNDGDNLHQTKYYHNSTKLNSPKLIYSPTKFNGRLLTQSLDRRQYHVTIRRPIINGNVSRLDSPFMWRRSIDQQPQRSKSNRLEWPVFNALGSQDKRTVSSINNNAESPEDHSPPSSRLRPLRQSWPQPNRQQANVVTVVQKTESTLLPSSRSSSFRIRRVWTKSAEVVNLASEEDTSPPRFTPKRKRNLETDEIEAKRQDCHV